jgi:hypothetical protein
MLCIRPVQINDINGIRQVARDTWVHTYNNIYSTDFISRFLENAYSEISLERSISRDEEQLERNFFVVVSDDTELIGYGHVKPEELKKRLDFC